MKNLLFVSSECVPFIKTGGLADVVGSLPKCFDKQYYDCRVFLPKYMCMDGKWKDQLEYVTHFYMDYDGQSRYVGVLKMEYDGVLFYFLDNEYYFSGDKPYLEHHWDIERFIFFDKAVLSALPLLDFRPDGFRFLISDPMLYTAMTGRRDLSLCSCMTVSRAVSFSAASSRL